MADSLESQLTTHFHRAGVPVSLVHQIDSASAGTAANFSERERSLMRLTRTIAQLVDRVQSEVASEGLYDLPPTPAVLPTAAEPDTV
jgi:hypothetical protein